MRFTCLKSIAGWLLVAASNYADAETSSGLFSDYQKALGEGRVSYVAEIDNDTLLLNRNDGFYTSGMRYAQRYALRETEKLTVFGWRIGQELYTPSDIKLPPEMIGPPDHPYAGWLYGGFFKETHRIDGSRLRVGIDIGCLGPCAGGDWTQTQFHRLLGQPVPQGWSKQVRNEPGIVAHADFAPIRWMVGPSTDITPSVNARFGNIFVDAGAGLQLRTGRLNVLPGEATLHAFLRADAHVVGYNATLQGGYFSKRDPHTVKPKRFVGEAQIGLAWTEKNAGATLALVRRGNEIRDMPDSTGAQNYLQLQFFYAP